LIIQFKFHANVPGPWQCRRPPRKGNKRWGCWPPVGTCQIFVLSRQSV
jgi:hypothetical protein